jgi:hypothetical protein
VRKKHCKARTAIYTSHSGNIVVESEAKGAVWFNAAARRAQRYVVTSSRTGSMLFATARGRGGAFRGDVSWRSRGRGRSAAALS